MSREKPNMVVVDLPGFVIRKYMCDSELSVHQQARHALERALPKYFDQNGHFTGLRVGFPFQMYGADDKKGKGSETFHRLSFCITREMSDQLDKIKRYTFISRKSAAEILVITELLQREAAKYAEDRALSYK